MADPNGPPKGLASRTRLFAQNGVLHSISQRCVRRIRRALTRTRFSPGVEVDDLVHDPPPEFPEARAAADRSELLQRSRAQIEMCTSLLAVEIGCSGRCQVLGHAISVSAGCCGSERLPAAMTAFMEGTDSSTNYPEIPENSFQAATAWLSASTANAPPAEFVPARFVPLIRRSSGNPSGAGGSAEIRGDWPASTRAQ